MAPKADKEKGKGKRNDLDRFTGLIGANTLEIGSTNIPNPSKLAMFDTLWVLAKRTKDDVPKKLLAKTLLKGKGNMRHRPGISTEGSSSSSLYVIDLNATKWG
ncbi:hypothetical protein OWV82_018723 [Melia azedarach]|uniref:Uncharacterized protein n=1 Tax=Melia azedarach TaxID=155640 RepID=A0ACC1XCA6_MELAZ|nr:hypothetical protein OWV82_018723 [Melia azedarach]